MREISLHLLDIAENSVAANAKNIKLLVCEDLQDDKLTASVMDDGKGMSAEMAAKVVDPFAKSDWESPFSKLLPRRVMGT
jgi:nitrogen fixation/metabolism regulation signal transduction histidine kinase